MCYHQAWQWNHITCVELATAMPSSKQGKRLSYGSSAATSILENLHSQKPEPYVSAPSPVVSVGDPGGYAAHVRNSIGRSNGWYVPTRRYCGPYRATESTACAASNSRGG